MTDDTSLSYDHCMQMGSQHCQFKLVLTVEKNPLSKHQLTVLRHNAIYSICIWVYLLLSM